MRTSWVRAESGTLMSWVRNPMRRTSNRSGPEPDSGIGMVNRPLPFATVRIAGSPEMLTSDTTAPAIGVPVVLSRTVPVRCWALAALTVREPTIRARPISLQETPRMRSLLAL